MDQQKRNQYEIFLRSMEHIPVFYEAWWLDAISHDSWDYVSVSRNNEIFAALVYTYSKKYIFNVVHNPLLTPYQGIINKYPPNQKMTTRLEYEKDIFNQLIEQLPSFDYYDQKFRPEFTNWLSFRWKGFSQTTCYSYVLEDISDVQEVFKNFRDNIKSDIRKAQKNLTVEDGDVESFYRLNSLTFSRQGMKVPYELETVMRIDRALSERNRRKIFIARDEQGRTHSGVYIIWDDRKAYYLMGGSDPSLRNSGATSLCLWNAINFASGFVNEFDFEGSDIEPVERFFRAFGAKQHQYFHIKKINSRLLKLAFFLKGRGLF